MRANQQKLLEKLGNRINNNRLYWLFVSISTKTQNAILAQYTDIKS